VAAMFVNGSKQNEQILYKMLLTKFHIIWPNGFRGKAVLEIDQ
jgi:hypothetical protein